MKMILISRTLISVVLIFSCSLTSNSQIDSRESISLSPREKIVSLLQGEWVYERTSNGEKSAIYPGEDSAKMIIAGSHIKFIRENRLRELAEEYIYRIEIDENGYDVRMIIMDYYPDSTQAARTIEFASEIKKYDLIFKGLGNPDNLVWYHKVPDFEKRMLEIRKFIQGDWEYHSTKGFGQTHLDSLPDYYVRQESDEPRFRFRFTEKNVSVVDLKTDSLLGEFNYQILFGSYPENANLRIFKPHKKKRADSDFVFSGNIEFISESKIIFEGITNDHNHVFYLRVEE